MGANRQPTSWADTAAPSRSRTAATEAVLLVDLENMVGPNARARTVTARLQALTRCAEPGVTVVAACAQTRITPDAAQVLHDHHVALLTVDGSKDAADDALLAEAQRRADRGCRRFVVASNDSVFGRLADLGELQIVIWTTQRPRANYTARASRVHRLSIPDVSAAPSSKAAVKTSVGSRFAFSGLPRISFAFVPTDEATVPRAGARAARVSRQRDLYRRQRASLDMAIPLAWPVAVGFGWLAAGMIFGVGAVLGDRTAHRVIRSARRGE